MSWSNIRSRKRHEARVLPNHAGRYGRLVWFRWYHIQPGDGRHEGRCWVIGYGVKELVELQHFEIREVVQEKTGR